MPLLSSWTLQALIHANWKFTMVYAIVTAISILYKASKFNHGFGVEIAVLVLILLYEPIRLSIGMSANKRDSAPFLALFFALCGPSLAVGVYFVSMQYISLRLDTAINVVFIIFVVGEVLLTLIQLLRLVQLLPQELKI